MLEIGTHLNVLFYNLVFTYFRLQSVHAVKGCVTYVAGENYSMRQSICDKPDTHFQVIPAALPSQVVKLTINHQSIYRLNASQLLHLPNLTYLDLDSNQLTVIEPGTFNRLPFLRTLSLRFNMLSFTIDSFHPDVFYGLVRLEYLNLYRNPISIIPGRIFSPLGSNLRTLILGGSTGEFTITPDALLGLKMLESLDLTSNQMETFPESMESVLDNMNLKEFYIYHNPWKCDCRLRWLKSWFLRRNSTFVFSKSVPDGMNHDLLDKNINMWVDPSLLSSEAYETILQPKCKSPFSLYGRPLFDHPDNHDIEGIRTSEFVCASRALNSNQPVHLTVATNATITCEFFADPSGVVYWYRNGTRINSNEGRFSSVQGQGRTLQAVLTIGRVEWADTGIYTCLLDTGHDSVNSTFEVIVGAYDYNMLSASSVLRWMNGLNTKMVLKFTGIITACLIVLLMFIGIVIYCLCTNHHCNKTERIMSNANEQKSTGDAVNLPTKKANGTQIQPENDMTANAMCRKQRSTLVNRQTLNLHQSHSVDIPGASTTTNFDNYVAIRIVPASNMTDGSLQNYAFIQPFGTDNLVFTEPSQIGTLLSRSGEPLSLIDQLSPTNVQIMNGSPHTSEATIAQSTHTTNDQCPLHGMYATLRVKRKVDPTVNSKRPITTIPVGLESVSEKRFNTLPSRKKHLPSINKPSGKISNSTRIEHLESKHAAD